jgi:predicted MFS family arabinose efflux permease
VNLRCIPSYRRLWSAVAISETGDWLLFIALPVYVFQVSGSAMSTSTVFLAELVPAVVVGTLCGAVIDRRNPPRLLTALTTIQAVALLPLLWLGPGGLWMVYAVAGVQAAITGITVPGLQAAIPLVVPSEQLTRANGMAQVASNAARLCGAPLGGLLLPVVGLHGLVLGDIATFLASAALLAGCRTAPTADHRQATGRLAATAEGWRAARRDPTLASALVIAFLGAVAQGMFLVLFVLFVLRSLGAGDEAVGLLRGVQAIGGVLGGLVVAIAAKRIGARWLTVGGLAMFGLISLLTWNSPAITDSTWWYAALFIAVGVPATAIVTGLITGTQHAAPPRVRGRVLSLIGVSEALGQGAGILIAGLLASSVSLTLLLDGQASLYVACAVVAGASFGLAPRASLPRRPVVAHGPSPSDRSMSHHSW